MASTKPRLLTAFILLTTAGAGLRPADAAITPSSRDAGCDSRGAGNFTQGRGPPHSPNVVQANQYQTFEGQPVSYDDAGSLNTIGARIYQHDGWGQLRSATGDTASSTFAYDALGRRVREQAGNGAARYLAWNGSALVAMGADNNDPSSFTLCP